MTDLWDDVPNVTTDGRSLPEFPDPHPEFTAAVWDRWRADQAARVAAVPVADPDADGANDVYKNNEPPVITLEAEEFDEPCNALGSAIRLAHANGWTLVELAHSRATARGRVVKSGAREGQRNKDWDIETQWIKLEKSGVGRAVISYTLVNGATYNVYRSFNGMAGRSDAEMKAILKGESQ